ncbi:MAG: DNA/RNA nuclease SfsA, partial [bacterium]|nr:DNA/RNA nuclease SfsA [bacterium]MDW8163658.1 DNA/RNA nuclease SfsA [Candidatus Omnitrophota bacterium]
MKEAIFIKRISRFIVECELNKEKITAHLPNPGRLWELLIPGRKIYLKETKNRLNYRVFGIEKNKYFICLDTHYTNILVKKFIQQGTIRELKGYTIKKEEFKIGNSKIDFLLQKNKELLPLEVKSCTLFNDGIAMFPDAITERGKKHLEILEKNNGAIIFLVYCPDIRYFLPEFHIDPLFSEKLYRIKDKILIKAISVKWIKNEEFKFVKDIEIPWEIYEKEGKDEG